MKAAVLTDLEQISVQKISEPECGDNEAVIEVKACAVCGSDIRIFHYGNDRVEFPAVMGHEIAHVIARHGAEQMSQSLVIQLGGMALSEAITKQPETVQSIFINSYRIGSEVCQCDDVLVS